ncbi:MAG: anaerobic ribonucleoside-triphosphate reductase, partial [Duncaniella sp.]|nr:anaerobic ribonucleoside-triphosphate reductase [Duncaniella sp.]
EVAKRYIAYRDQRSIARRAKTRDMFLEIIEAKSNDITRENANMNTDSPAGMMMKFASETTKPFVDDYLLSAEVREAVNSGYIHIHDKDYYPTKSLTCVQHPLDRILRNGFIAGHGESRPAKRIETASIIGCISLETAQNEMHGGQAIPAFDFYLAPFVRYSYIEEVKNLERLTGSDLSHLYNVEIKDYLKKELDGLSGEQRYLQHAINQTVARVHQSMEAFIHNMNTIHSRGGNQVVFSSINYGTDTSAEGRCVIRELLHTTYEGVGNGATAIFPIQIWKKKRGVSYLPEDPNYDLYQLACKVTARRFFPNFLNLDASFNQHEKWTPNDPERYKNQVATMGCRTRVFENRFGDKTSIGRG